MRQEQQGNEDQQRKRSHSILSRVSTFPSRPHSSSRTSSIKSNNNAPQQSNPSLLDRFEYFTLLPLELQAYILTFLSSRTLHKTMGRTNRYYRELIESHTRRRILTLMSPSPWDVRSTADHYKAYFHKRPANVLVVGFEAQRPIDTLTTKHTLHFSHFSRTEAEESSSSSSTLAHFSFVPIERSDIRSSSIDSNRTSSSNDPTSPFLPPPPAPAPTASAAYPGNVITARIPIVHANDQNRLVQRTVTSSVTSSSAPRSQAGNSSSSSHNRQDRFTDVSSPMEWRETSMTSARLVPVEESGEIGYRANRAQGRGYEGFNASAPQLTGHWSEPIASSSAAYESDRYESSEEATTTTSAEHGKKKAKVRRQRKPAYRFQLDPLDSFETWILSLSLQRKSDSSHGGLSAMRPLRWEKRVAEGLDRVFREWFSPPDGATNDELTRSLGQGNSALHRASLIASLGCAAHSSSMPTTTTNYSSSSTVKASAERINIGEDDDQEEQEPEPRMLEFDGTSCTMMIQPHAVAKTSPLHPALTSMSSHHYLSNSSLYSHWHDSLTSRVEFTFHCESLTINAARLLNVLEEVERDVERASDQAKARGAHIVAGSSGGTTWAYSTGGSNFVSNDSSSSTSRWTSSSQGETGVSVLVFGAVRD